MNEGLVSTIIPVYNRPALLAEAVSSVLQQQYRPIEIIMVDDGSTDDTPRVATALAAQHPDEIRIITQINQGTGLAREAGRRAAKGEFIQYLDSDDLLLPNKFEAQVSGLRSNPECAVSYGKTRYRYSDGSIDALPWKRSGTRVKTMFPSFLTLRWWDTPTPLYRSKICELAGPWTDLRLEEDWEYDCRIAALGVSLHYCDEFVAEVRDHSQNRLCRGSGLDPFRLRHRALAHELILQHALRAGIDESFSEMRHFARELFLLSRQCGAAGLARESRVLFELSRKASGERRANGLDFRLYKLLGCTLGWSAAGRIGCYSDTFRK
jgi:glycosyltransferase involved in cell wall biosynthesis